MNAIALVDSAAKICFVSMRKVKMRVSNFIKN